MIFILFLLFNQLIITGTASAQKTDEPMADELRERFKGENFSLGILLQSQGFFSLDNSDFNGGRSWDLGSTRIDFRGHSMNGGCPGSPFPARLGLTLIKR